MSRTSVLEAVLVASAVLAGCGAAPMRIGAIDDMERVRSAPATREGAKVAPEAYARAEQERDFAREARTAGDNLGATLHAERAVAAYDHALAVARLARATTELADAQKSLDDATAQEASLDASRASLDRDADELEQRVRIARDRMLPASSGRATPEREAARAVAAQSLAMQAKLLCSAARLIAADAVGLSDAEGEVAKLEDRAPKAPRIEPIDDAARARAHCLDVLTRARRAGDAAAAADALLAELSAAGGWDPARDERGVIVTLRDAFKGAEITGGAAAKLKELGRVGAAHPLVALQVVVHDARAPAANDTTDAKRAEAAVQALTRAGVAASHVHAEVAGAQLPIADPTNPKARERNERLEVVFVGGGK